MTVETAHNISHHADISHWPLKPQQIILIRQKLGKTQVEMARILSVDPSTVGRWESGRSQPRRIYIRLITKIMQEHS